MTDQPSKAAKSGEEMYALLRQRDAHIACLREALDKLVWEFAALYAEDEQNKASERAREKLRQVYYEVGLRSDGSLRD